MPGREFEVRGRLRERHRAWIEATLDRARSLDADDERRRRTLDELRFADVALVFAAARALVASAETAHVLLGVQVLDGLFLDYGDSDSGDQADRLVRAGEDVLGPLCRWDQDPEILAAALPSYTAVTRLDPQPLLHGLLRHPHARVRRTAERLLAMTLPGPPLGEADRPEPPSPDNAADPDDS